MKQLAFWARALLFASAATPLLVAAFAPFPFVFGKMIFFRSIVGIVAALGALYLVLEIQRRQWRISWGWVRNPIVVALAIFIFSAAISTALSPSPYRGFFGEVERAEGLYGLLAYFIFFIAALFLFKPKDWQVYFRIGLCAGALLIVHAFLQYLRFDSLPFAGGTPGQPGSLMGNPALVTGFLVLLLAYAVLVYRASTGFWRYFAALTALAALGMVGALGVRGAQLGIAAGFTVFALGTSFGAGRSRLKRVVVLGVLALLLFMGVLARITRENSFWQYVPVFDRVAAFSAESASVQTRLLSFKVSWDAFKERPLFGWGLENYAVAYNTHYDPAYAVYAEDWFDRAHNKILDVLVMQGVVGIASYLAIFAAFFLVLWRAEELRGTRLFLGSILVAYFVQNLFLFDHISSYLPFFAILAFSASFYGRERKGADAGSSVPSLGRVLLTGLSATAALLSIYSVVAWNAIPLAQALRYARATEEERPAAELVAGSKRFLRPYNFFQKELRTRFLLAVLPSGGQGSDELRPLALKALAALEEVLPREPYDLRLKVRLAEAYNQLGGENEEFFKKGEELVMAAQELSPKRQALRGLQTLILSGAGRHEEAVQLARETLALEPRTAKSHYYLGMALALSLKGVEEAIKELDIARELGAKDNYVLFALGDFLNMMTAYQNLGALDGADGILDIIRRYYPHRTLDYYKQGLLTARAKRDAVGIIHFAELIKESDARTADSMEVIIDLARKGRWEILDDL